MQTAGQLQQPVPLYYGEIAGGATETVSLDSGFDYVLTCVLVQPVGGASSFLVIKDESAVPILATATPTSGAVSPGQGLLIGEMPIGPRTELQLALFGEEAYVFVAGYALTPPTTLHV